MIPMRDLEAELKEALAERDALAQACPLCGHKWRQHDPEDGMCDAHSDEPGGIGACKCGRDIDWTREKIAALSRRALAAPAAPEKQDG